MNHLFTFSIEIDFTTRSSSPTAPPPISLFAVCHGEAKSHFPGCDPISLHDTVQQVLLSFLSKLIFFSVNHIDTVAINFGILGIEDWDWAQCPIPNKHLYNFLEEKESNLII